MEFFDKVNHAYDKGMKARINNEVINTIKTIAKSNQEKSPQERKVEEFSR